MNLKEFKIVVNLLNKSLDVIYIPKNVRVIEIKLKGEVDWNKLAKIIEEGNLSRIQVTFDLSQPLTATMLDLEDYSIIAKAQTEVNIDFIKLIACLLNSLFK